MVDPVMLTPETSDWLPCANTGVATNTSAALLRARIPFIIIDALRVLEVSELRELEAITNTKDKPSMSIGATQDIGNRWSDNHRDRSKGRD